MKNNFIDKIQKIIHSKYLMTRSEFLSKSFIHIPQNGASNDDIKNEEDLLGKCLSEDYKVLLKKYNGINLDIIRFCGVGDTEQYIDRLVDSQAHCPKDKLLIGKSPSGLCYLMDNDGKIYWYDTREIDSEELLARSLSELIDDILFGVHAESFAGEEWKEELKQAGIV